MKAISKTMQAVGSRMQFLQIWQKPKMTGIKTDRLVRPRLGWMVWRRAA